MVYIVDIDGTICKTEGTDYENSKPIYGRIAQINNLFDNGDTVIYYTARGSTKYCSLFRLTEKQLQEWGCKYSELRMGKVPYDKWIDDRAINSEQYFK